MRLFLIVLALLLLQSCSTTSNKHHSSGYCNVCVRTRLMMGHIKRDMTARKAFMEQSGYPDGRPDYVVDHIIPLYKGGQDTPENMQWITVEEHKAKHRDL